MSYTDLFFLLNLRRTEESGQVMHIRWVENFILFILSVINRKRILQTLMTDPSCTAEVVNQIKECESQIQGIKDELEKHKGNQPWKTESSLPVYLIKLLSVKKCLVQILIKPEIDITTAFKLKSLYCCLIVNHDGNSGSAAVRPSSTFMKATSV